MHMTSIHLFIQPPLCLHYEQPPCYSFVFEPQQQKAFQHVMACQYRDFCGNSLHWGINIPDMTERWDPSGDCLSTFPLCWVSESLKNDEIPPCKKDLPVGSFTWWTFFSSNLHQILTWWRKVNIYFYTHLKDKQWSVRKLLVWAFHQMLHNQMVNLYMFQVWKGILSFNIWWKKINFPTCNLTGNGTQMERTLARSWISHKNGCCL